MGDLVLRENPKNQVDREKKGKWEANWLGPFVIVSSFGMGTYKLADCDGDELFSYTNNDVENHLILSIDTLSSNTLSSNQV